MRVKKILNNNAILAVDLKGREVIATGTGIGFQASAGMLIDDQKVSRVFVPSSAGQIEKYRQLLENLDPFCAEISEQAIETAEKEFGFSLNEMIYVSLTDHIDGMISRLKNNVHMPKAMSAQIARQYPGEYRMGLYICDLIEQKTGLKPGNEEAGFIALHFINHKNRTENEPQAQFCADEFIRDVMALVKEGLQLELEESSLSVCRFQTHLKYLFERLQTCEEVFDDPEIYLQISKSCPKTAKFTEKISGLISLKYQRQITLEEKAYLVIYIEKLLRESRKKQNSSAMPAV